MSLTSPLSFHFAYHVSVLQSVTAKDRKEVLVVRTSYRKEDLAVSRTQAKKATRNQPQEEVLAGAKRSSCECIIFGLYCNPSPFKVFNIPAGWRPWSSIRVLT